MRPLWYEFPADEESYSREGVHMVGDSLLVSPVLTKGATTVDVYFPGATVWYDYWTSEKLEVSGVRNIAAPYDKVYKTSTKVPGSAKALNSIVL